MNNQNQKTVLIVNDSSDQRDSMRVIFRQAEYRVLAASNGREGFDLAKSSRLDLIVSDAVMIGGDGIELCRWIRADEKLRGLPILLVGELRSHVAEGLKVGADDYVELPVEPVNLVARAERLIERKRTEDLLRERESYFRSLIENVSDLISILAPDGTMLYESPSLRQILGYEPEELLGKNAFDFIHPSDQEKVLHYFQNAVQSSGIELPIEYRFKDKSGCWRILESVGKAVNNPTKGVVAVINSRDITERRQAEDDLRRSQRQYESLVHSIDGVVWEMNAQTLQLTFVSKQAEKMLGYRAEEITSDRNFWLSRLHADDYTRVCNLLTETVEKKQETEFDYRVITADGRVTWLRNNISVDVIGNEAKFLRGVTIDITERKAAEVAIDEANKRAIREYERLIDRLVQLAESLGTARDLRAVYRALYAFAAVSVPCTGFFISLYDAPRNVRLPGYATVDGEEIDISNLPPLEMSESPNSRAISTGAVVIEDDFQAATADKPVVHIGMDKNPDLPQSCLVAPMSVMGRIVGAIEAQSSSAAAYTKEHATAMRMAANLAANAIENARLLEQERAREEQLRLSQKLESVGRLAGGIAHDFNNMLTAINGYSELTLRRLSKDDPLRRNIEEIKKAGERSAELTHQLLAFSRKQVLQSRVLDLNETITETAQMLKRLIGEDIRLDTVLSSSLGQVEADPGQISQVLTNLAVNARDAMPEGGKLTIETANVVLDSEYVTQHAPLKSGSYVLLAVTDNGVGINTETQQHIFEPFFTTKEIGKGTGLGLATVYGIVKQSGGYIWVYSEIGHGTSFKIYLPRIDDEAAGETTSGEAQNSPEGAETILIVEDEDIVRALTRRILEESGYRILEASNGIEALSICRRQDYKIDLLMTDVVMPEMGGRELAEKLSLIQPNLRVLFTSGYTDDAIIRHDVIEADTNFIQKPFTFDALAHKVREALDAEN